MTETRNPPGNDQVTRAEILRLQAETLKIQAETRVIEAQRRKLALQSGWRAFLVPIAIGIAIGAAVAAVFLDG